MLELQNRWTNVLRCRTTFKTKNFLKNNFTFQWLGINTIPSLFLEFILEKSNTHTPSFFQQNHSRIFARIISGCCWKSEVMNSNSLWSRPHLFGYFLKLNGYFFFSFYALPLRIRFCLKMDTFFLPLAFPTVHRFSVFVWTCENDLNTWRVFF